MALPLLLIGGAAALALLAKSRGKGSAVKPDVSTLEDDTDQQGEIDLIDDVAEMQTRGTSAQEGIVGGLSSASGQYSGVIKTVGAITAAIDQALGGTGSGRGAVYLSIGAIVAIALVYFSAGWVAIVVWTIVVAVIFITDAIVDDANRVAHQRAGGSVKYCKDARSAIEGQTAGTVQGHFKMSPIVPAGSSPYAGRDGVSGGWNPQAQRVAIPFSDGFAKQSNTLARLAWEKRPAGAFQSQSDHIKWGHERGYFLYPEEMTFRSSALDSPALLALVTEGERGPGNPPVDAYWVKFVAMGEFCANVAAYSQHMQSPHGVGLDNDAHCAWGIKNGLFEGECIPGNATWDSMEHGVKTTIDVQGGALSYKGKVIYYLNGSEPGVYVKMTKEGFAAVEKAHADLAAAQQVISFPPPVPITYDLVPVPKPLPTVSAPDNSIADMIAASLAARRPVTAPVIARPAPPPPVIVIAKPPPAKPAAPVSKVTGVGATKGKLSSRDF